MTNFLISFKELHFLALALRLISMETYRRHDQYPHWPPVVEVLKNCSTPVTQAAVI